MNSRSRRSFLRAGGALVPGYLSLGAGLSLMGGDPAIAATGDYRALVCVFLNGGNDGNNTVIPVSTSRYQQYASVRQDLAIARNEIVPLDADLGLHPSLALLKDIFDGERLAILNNVGPLSRPMTQAQYFEWSEFNDPNQVPENLFSHHDQQILWQNAASTAAVRTGWGGRFMETLNNGQTVFSFNSNARFGAGVHTKEMVIPTPGTQLGLEGFSGNGQFADARLAALQSLIQATEPNRLHKAMAQSQQLAFSVSNTLGPLLAQGPQGNAADPENPEISAAFGNLAGATNSRVARQLYQVAKMIKQRNLVGGDRHIYFVTMGGFDTHSNQLDDHAGLLAQLGAGLSAFDQAMQAIDAGDAVTLFTESDFGRTLKPNSSAGSDHGWGNTHLVMGGAVKGGQNYGALPSLELGGPDDAGKNEWEHQGRWIPEHSVDQYVSTLANWFAPEAAASLNVVLPNLSRFNIKDIGFMGNSVAA